MNEDFDKWFNSLSKEEQNAYIEEMKASYWIDYAKENPIEY